MRSNDSAQTQAETEQARRDAGLCPMCGGAVVSMNTYPLNEGRNMACLCQRCSWESIGLQAGYPFYEDGELR